MSRITSITMLGTTALSTNCFCRNTRNVLVFTLRYYKVPGYQFTRVCVTLRTFLQVFRSNKALCSSSNCKDALLLCLSLSFFRRRPFRWAQSRSLIFFPILHRTRKFLQIFMNEVKGTEGNKSPQKKLGLSERVHELKVDIKREMGNGQLFVLSSGPTRRSVLGS